MGHVLRVSELYELADGARVVCTNCVKGDEVLSALAVPLREWADEHDDPRGVPSFSSNDLNRVDGARSYDDALGRLGPWVVFLGA